MMQLTENNFYAIITMGLKMGHEGEKIPTRSVFQHLSKIQDDLILNRHIYLSANCWKSTIVFSGQNEKHLNIKFINYPKFPIQEDVFKETVCFIAQNLMEIFNQIRLVIEFKESFIMYETENDVNPKILKVNEIIK